jgi:dethiobiotin synthetase
MSAAFFVTGTSTGIGKTYALTALLYGARHLGWAALGLKPVAAGVDSAGKNEDVEAIRQANSLVLPETTLNTYLFPPPIAPHLAAADAGRAISFASIRAALADAQARLDAQDKPGIVLVEGVGGFRVPLGQEGDSADLAVALGLPVILVVGMQLGCLNHALLTADAIMARGLPLAGWIANSLPGKAMARFADNLATLATVLPAPCLGVLPAGHPGDTAAAWADYLVLPCQKEIRASL